MIKKLNSNGYTLIELMLAMGLFSAILIISTVGFIGINRTYTRGVIRKQLSESIQKVSTDITTALQIQPAGSVTFCSESDQPPAQPNCTSQNYNVLCFSGTRYYWPSHVSGDGGMYKDSNSCSSEDFSSNNEVIDQRFVVEDLNLVALPGSLYQVKGVIHTADLNALTITDNSGVYTDQRVMAGFDPYKTRCKGSSAGNVVQTCSVEKFDFVINSRGNHT